MSRNSSKYNSFVVFPWFSQNEKLLWIIAGTMDAISEVKQIVLTGCGSTFIPFFDFHKIKNTCVFFLPIGCYCRSEADYLKLPCNGSNRMKASCYTISSLLATTTLLESLSQAHLLKVMSIMSARGWDSVALFRVCTYQVNITIPLIANKTPSAGQEKHDWPTLIPDAVARVGCCLHRQHNWWTTTFLPRTIAATLPCTAVHWMGTALLWMYSCIVGKIYWNQ